MRRKPRDPGYTLQLQQSTKTGLYRCKLVLKDGTVHAIGDTSDDPTKAKFLAIHAAKQKNWNASPLRALLDRIENGTATPDDLRDMGF